MKAQTTTPKQKLKSARSDKTLRKALKAREQQRLAQLRANQQIRSVQWESNNNNYNSQ